jgi:DNA-directed RNA polymerase subunit M/transcription elongation factor TFIIS
MMKTPEDTFKAFGIKPPKKLLTWLNNIENDNERDDKVYSLIHNCMKDAKLIKKYDTIPLGIDSEVFIKHRERQEEQDNFISCPFTVTKNDDIIIACNKCGSNQTFSMTIQNRSCDEAMSCAILCQGCGHRELRRG